MLYDSIQNLEKPGHRAAILHNSTSDLDSEIKKNSVKKKTQCSWLVLETQPREYKHKTEQTRWTRGRKRLSKLKTPTRQWWLSYKTDSATLPQQLTENTRLSRLGTEQHTQNDTNKLRRNDDSVIQRNRSKSVNPNRKQTRARKN